MTRLLGILALLAIAIAALGFYLGWFQFSTTKSPDHKTSISVTVDEEKIQHDKQKAAEELRKAEEKAAEELRKLKKS